MNGCAKDSNEDIDFFYRFFLSKVFEKNINSRILFFNDSAYEWSQWKVQHVESLLGSRVTGRAVFRMQPTMPRAYQCECFICV